MSRNINNKACSNSKYVIQVRSRPHIVDLEATRGAQVTQARHISERKFFSCTRRRRVDDEHMDHLARLAGVVLGRRCNGHRGVCDERQSGSSEGGILVECKEFSVLDKLCANKSTGDK